MIAIEANVPTLFINFKYGVCSFGPVFNLDCLPGILVRFESFKLKNGVFGHAFETERFEQEVEKFKRTLNLECNIHPLFEPRLDDGSGGPSLQERYRA